MIDKIRLLIMEDNNLLREGFLDLFKNQQKLEVDVRSGDEDELYRAIKWFNPHVILLNSRLQGQYSLEVVPRMTRIYPNVKVVLMGLALSRDEVTDFMDAGSAGFILKDVTPQEFLKKIKAIAKGENTIPEPYTDLLLSQIVELAVHKREFVLKESVQISKFELKLLQHVNEGLNDNEIGEKLGITPESVKTHIHNVKQNLSLFSLLELVNIFTPDSQPWDDDLSSITNN